MGIQIAKVTGMSEQTSRTGSKYTQFDTSIGKLNIFDADKVEALQGCLGQYAVVDVVRREKYLNVQNVPHVASKEQLEAAKLSGELETIKPEEQVEFISKKPIVERVIHEIVDERATNWVEVGKAGERMKIYFKEYPGEEVKTTEELKRKLRNYAVAIRSALYTDMDGMEPELTKDNETK